MGETELADSGCGTIRVREAVRNRVPARSRVRQGIRIDIWKGKYLDDLDIADITVDEIGTVEYEEVSPRKVDLDEMG